MAIKLARRLLSVEEYHKMAEAGILKERGIELINGEIIEMSPIGSNHASIVDKLKDLLTIGLFQKAIVRVQNPISVSDFSEPEPDLAIVKYRSDYYKMGHPKPVDILTVIEVAVSSVEYNEEIKLPLYAENHIKEYWLIKVDKQQVQVHTKPAGKDYQVRRIYNRGEVINLVGFDFTILVDDLFGE